MAAAASGGDGSGAPPPPAQGSGPSKAGPLSSTGWDGKLRVDKRAILANPEALEDSEYSDEDAPPVEQIAADEDLLNDYPEDEEEIDLVHRGIVNIPALKLQRFKKAKRLCLRQNQISDIILPPELATTLNNLELDDNLISHIRGLEPFTSLTSLDLSYNKIKHIKNISHLTKLTDLYFVSNRISKIEHLETFVNLRQVELGANRIREIENLDRLQNLRELWLAKNKIEELKNLGELRSLRLLSIQSNRLRSLDGLQELASLEELYVSHNAIERIERRLDGNAKLRVLDVSNNPIDRLEGLERLPALEEFWASNCALASFAEVEGQLADKEALETVYFEGNPLQRSDETGYRRKVRLALPQVKQIDATYVQVS